MTPFATVNQLVMALFESRCPPGQSRFGLVGDAARTFQAERAVLVTSHGWDPEEFQERVEEYISDHEVTE